MLELVTYSQPVYDVITDYYFWDCSGYAFHNFCMFLMPEVLL